MRFRRRLSFRRRWKKCGFASQSWWGRLPNLKGLERTHRVVAVLLEEDKARIEKRNASSYSSFYDQPFFASPFERRRLKLLNSIFLALAKRGITSHAKGKNPNEFTIHVGDSGVTFKLDDPKTKTERESWRPPSDERRPASDPLHLTVSWYLEKVDGLRLVWGDSKEVTIESLLQEIVVELVVAGEMQVRASELYSHARRVEHKADLIEATRQREEEAKRKERLSLQRTERARIEHLLDDTMSLRLANDLRVYVQVQRSGV